MHASHNILVYEGILNEEGQRWFTFSNCYVLHI